MAATDTQEAIADLIEAVDQAFSPMGILSREEWERIKVEFARRYNP